MSRFPKWSLSLRFTPPKLPHTCYMPYLTHSNWFEHPIEIRCGVQIILLLCMCTDHTASVYMYRSYCFSCMCTDHTASRVYVQIILLLCMCTDHTASRVCLQIILLLVYVYRSYCFSCMCTDHTASVYVYRSYCFSCMCKLLQSPVISSVLDHTSPSGLYSRTHPDFVPPFTLTLLTWRIWWPPNNASKWQMGFNSAFKGLMWHTAYLNNTPMWHTAYLSNTPMWHTAYLSNTPMWHNTYLSATTRCTPLI